MVADISPAGSMAKFSTQYPERFINVGVAEQSMIGICAGLALKGCQPFAYTIATFTLYRPFEMVRDDLCYQNLPVTVVGMGAGVIYSTLGGTHHTQEDIAIAGALPNMQIIAPCDPAECTEATLHCATQKKGPIYLRIGKAGEPNYTDKAVDPWVFGKLRYIKRGRDVCILSYGVIMKTAMQLAQKFEAQRQVGVRRLLPHAQAPRRRWHPRGACQTRPCRGHRGACAARRLGAAHQADRLGKPGPLPARHVHAAGCVHPQLWQP